MIKVCERCKFWYVWPRYPDFGVCENEKTQKQVGTDLTTEILHRKDFGCINWIASNAPDEPPATEVGRKMREQIESDVLAHAMHGSEDGSGQISNYAMPLLKRLDPTMLRIVIKQILCEEHGITTHIVPEEVEVKVDGLMSQIFKPTNLPNGLRERPATNDL